MNTDACVNELVMRGCDDWIDACEISSVAKFVGGAKSEDEIKNISLNLIRELVLRDLMEIGDLPDKGQKRLQLWSMTPQECLDRAEREWRALGRNPSLGELYWFQNTDKGTALGERLFKARDGGQSPNSRMKTTRIIGVHPIVAPQPCYLIELEIGKPEGLFDWESVTQEIPGQLRTNWQMTYSEIPLNNNKTRWAFFFHYLNLSKPLLTSTGLLELPTPTALPGYLKHVKYVEP